MRDSALLRSYLESIKMIFKYPFYPTVSVLFIKYGSKFLFKLQDNSNTARYQVFIFLVTSGLLNVTFKGFLRITVYLIQGSHATAQNH